MDFVSKYGKQKIIVCNFKYGLSFVKKKIKDDKHAPNYLLSRKMWIRVHQTNKLLLLTRQVR